MSSDKDVMDNLALAGIIHLCPPLVQKIIVEKIMLDAKLKLTPNQIEEYEKYWKRVQEHFLRDYMEKK